jgi:hypothetical protein
MPDCLSACGSERERLAAAIEQHRAYLALNPLNVSRRGRLRHVEPARGPLNGSGFCDGHEGSQLSNFHGATLSK